MTFPSSFSFLRSRTAAAEAAVGALFGAYGETRCGADLGDGVARDGAGRKIRDGPAGVADGVVVVRHVRVEADRPAEAKRARETVLRERVERVVDGGEAHRREVVAQALEDVLRRGMAEVVG